jgi:zinc/manganese transport system permease protein
MGGWWWWDSQKRSPIMLITSLASQLFQYAFMRNAFAAGTAVAVLAGITGYFVVLRGETFAGHTLSQVGFPGAAGAVLLGIPQLVGLAVLCVGCALGIASLGRVGSGDWQGKSAAIGTIQAFALALGFLFASLYQGLLNGVNAILFGSLLGITEVQVLILTALTVVAVGTITVIGRPLLFLSVDPEAAVPAGVPANLLSVAFLVLLALSVAATTLITGALLVFALLVMPAAAAQQLVPHPSRAIALSVVLGLVTVWLALAMSYFSDYPVGFFITTLGLGLYLLARGTRALSRGRALG